MDKINNKFISAIEKYHMIDSGDRVTVALSGGADSVALLLLLREVKVRYQITVSAAHLNHGIRDAAGDADEQFVKTLCENLSVPLRVGHADIPAICKVTKESTELAARRVRYAFLQSCADGGKIATAHTLSDNSETVLFNLARGTGIKGLLGIPAVRGNIIRPLLLIDGEEVREYLTAIGQHFVTDSTNFSTEYSRNRIRLKVIPELKQINNGIHKNIFQCCSYLKDDDDCLNELAAEALRKAESDQYIETGTIKTLHRAVLSRVIRLFAEKKTGFSLDRIHTEELISLVTAGAGRRELLSGYHAELLKGRLYIINRNKPEGICEKRQISLKLCNKNKVNNLLLKNTIDYDKISDNLMVRGRQNGDKFRAAGRGVTKSLKKLFNEAAIPNLERDDIMILSDAEGIVWIEGFGAAERCSVDDTTQNILIVEYK